MDASVIARSGERAARPRLAVGAGLKSTGTDVSAGARGGEPPLREGVRLTSAAPLSSARGSSSCEPVRPCTRAKATRARASRAAERHGGVPQARGRGSERRNDRARR
jgi:hypothetical protein